MGVSSTVLSRNEGCCFQTARLQISDFRVNIYPSVIFSDWNDLYLDGDIRYALSIKTSASDTCRYKVLDRIEALIWGSIQVGFVKWKAKATQDTRWLIQNPITLTPYNQLIFKSEPKTWSFNMTCCDAIPSVDVHTKWDSFPTLIGYRVASTAPFVFPRPLTQPVIGEPVKNLIVS